MMDIERNDAFLPVILHTEDLEKVALMKAAVKAYTDEYERVFLSVQKRLKASTKQIDICTQEYEEIELQLNALEHKIIEAQLQTQESESEALQTVKENKIIKRKIITLKNDIEEQEKLLNRANETMQAVHNNSLKTKRVKLLPDVTS